MRALILGPDVKTFPAEDTNGFDPELVYLTNPLYQKRFAAPWGAGTRIVCDDDISSDERVFAELNETAKRWARQWFNEPAIVAPLTYEGVNLGSLYVHPLSYFFAGVLKDIYLKDSLVTKFGVTELREQRSSAQGKISRPGGPQPVVKTLLKAVNRLGLRSIPTGGIVYSCSLRHAMPLLYRGCRNYYLRENFSLKGYFDGIFHSFTHILPEYYAASPVDESLTKKVFEMIDRHFMASNWFDLNGRDLWKDFIRPRFEKMIFCEFPRSRMLMDRLRSFFDLAKPRAVVVDEDVVHFNKTLILCANQKNIRTYTLMHGAPFENVAFMPSSAKTVLAWGLSTQARLVEWGMSAETIRPVGAPQYESLEKPKGRSALVKVRRDLGITEGRILFLSMLNLYTNEMPGFKFTRDSHYETIFRQTIMIATGALMRLPDTALIIKLHPGEKHAWYAMELLTRISDPVIRNRVRVIQDYSTPELLSACSLALTTPSTVYFEALLLKRPVLVFDRAEERICSFMREDFLNVDAPDDCIRKITEFIEEQHAVEFLKKQEAEAKRHFVNGNTGAVERALIELER